MIDTVLRWIAVRFWRRRIAHNEQQRDEWTAAFMQWKRNHPDRCLYCAYTHWANSKQLMKLKLDPHTCVEGNSPPHPLPTAKVLV